MGDKTVLFVQTEPRGPSELVEVQILTAGLFRVNFPDVQQLRSMTTQNIIIKAIGLITTDALARAPISGNVGAPVAELQKISLVIYSQGWEKGHMIPLLFLNKVATPAGTLPYVLQKTDFNDWTNVDWSKSYLLYSNGTAGSAGTPYSVMFDVEYIKLDGEGNAIDGAS